MLYRSGTHAFTQGAYNASPFITGLIPFGLVAGVTAVGMGMSPTTMMGMTLLFYAGSAQMVVMQLMQNGALPVTILVTALVINLRYLMYSASLAPLLHPLPRRKTWPLSYLISDQAFALTSLKMNDGTAGRYALPYYAGAAITLWMGWNLSVLAGVVLGARIPDSWSLGFAVPLSFLALLIPSIRSAATLGAALTGGGIAVLAAGLPYNLGMLLGSVAGVMAGVFIEHLRKAPDAVGTASIEEKTS